MTKTPEDYELFHFGVKGMKWGVRKKDESSYRQRVSEIRNRPLEQKTLTTKTGLEIEVIQSRTPIPAARLIAANSKLYEKNKSFHAYDIKDKNGRGLGQAEFEMRDNGELNLGWLGVKPKSRGQGIATSIFDLGIAKGQELGAKKLTLEVPGNSPDAKHIYTKAGFKDDGPADDYDPDDVWGGLTKMSMDIKSIKHSANSDDDEVEEALVRLFEHRLQIAQGEFSHVNKSPEDYELLHYGVKGMKWGVSRSPKELAEGYDRNQYNYDKKEYNRKFANRVNKKVAKGDTVKEARRKTRNQRANAQLVVGLGLTATSIMMPTLLNMSVEGINRGYLGAVNVAEREGMRRGMKKANDLLADTRGLTSYETVSLTEDSDGVWR